MLNQILPLYILSFLLENFDKYPCSCCNAVKVDPLLTRQLVMLKFSDATEDLKLHCNSGYRCEAHNKAIGGHPGSHHVTGGVVDLRLTESERGVVLPVLKDKLRLPRIGVYSWGIHFDVQGPEPQRVWYG